MERTQPSTRRTQESPESSDSLSHHRRTCKSSRQWLVSAWCSLQFKSRIDEARSWFSSLEQTDFDDKSLQALFDEHDFYRKQILEASLDTLHEGQLLLERIKDLGAFTESVNQHSTVAACYEVEHLLGVHQDERHQFEDEWDRNRKLLSEYAQMSLVRQDIDQVGRRISRGPWRTFCLFP